MLRHRHQGVDRADQHFNLLQFVVFIDCNDIDALHADIAQLRLELIDDRVILRPLPLDGEFIKTRIHGPQHLHDIFLTLLGCPIGG